MKKIVNVAAAVMLREDGQFLLGQRAADTFYAGYWEFPGGKVEAGETPHAALLRELTEELGLQVSQADPWIVREHHYEHAFVRLHFFRVTQWQGKIMDHVHSALAWQSADRPAVAPMLPANAPVLKALRLPQTMAITQAHAIGIEAQLARLERALANGVRLVQIREPEMVAAQLQTFAQQTHELVKAHGGLCLLNQDMELAQRVGCNGVHLKSQQLMGCDTRPDFEWVGASCHTQAELQHAIQLGLDYAILGPVQKTSTHPDRMPMGWQTFAHAMRESPIPVFAIGGLGPSDLAIAQSVGAHGIAGIRAF